MRLPCKEYENSLTFCFLAQRPLKPPASACGKCRLYKNFLFLNTEVALESKNGKILTLTSKNYFLYFKCFKSYFKKNKIKATSNFVTFTKGK